ncbi:DUF3891 family protein [Candidatus Poribacteria bacterium]|nr:DUF3891 family protein [Candidatus Poribacteria bacterium]
MILRTVGDITTLIRQTDHAAASGEVAALLRPEYFEAGHTEAVVAATAHHDDGWIAWEAAPLRGENGAPLNFTALEANDHFDIWQRGIRLSERQLGAFAAAVITRHAQVLYEGVDGEAPEFFAKTISRLQRLAWPIEDPAVREWYIERGFYALKLGDILTLMGCAGWSGPARFNAIDDDGRHHEFSARLAGDWEVEVDGWPFGPPIIRLAVPVFEHDARTNWNGAVDLFLAKGPNSQRTLTIRHARNA